MKRGKENYITKNVFIVFLMMLFGFGMIACQNSGSGNREAYLKRLDERREEQRRLQEAAEESRRGEPTRPPDIEALDLAEDEKEKLAKNVALIQAQMGPVILRGPFVLNEKKLLSGYKDIITVDAGEEEEGTINGKKVAQFANRRQFSQDIHFEYMQPRIAMASITPQVLVLNPSQCELEGASAAEAEIEEDRFRGGEIFADELSDSEADVSSGSVIEDWLAEKVPGVDFDLKTDNYEAIATDQIGVELAKRREYQGKSYDASAHTVILCGPASTDQDPAFIRVYAKNLVLYKFNYLMDGDNLDYMKFEAGTDRLFLVGDNKIISSPREGGDQVPPAVRLEVITSFKKNQGGGHLTIKSTGADVEY